MAAWDSSAVGEDELVPISALQHMLYCPRQCALIHIERQWAENRYTPKGTSSTNVSTMVEVSAVAP